MHIGFKEFFFFPSPFSFFRACDTLFYILAPCMYVQRDLDGFVLFFALYLGCKWLNRVRNHGVTLIWSPEIT